MDEEIAVERRQFERKKMGAKERAAIMKGKGKLTVTKVAKVGPQEIQWQHFEMGRVLGCLRSNHSQQ